VLLLAVLQVVTAKWVVLAGSAVAGWCFKLVILRLGDGVRRACGRALPYPRDSAFPVYILHQVAIVVPGYFLLRLLLGIPAKFVLLLLIAITVALGLYQFVVRPLGPVAFLLGAKSRPVVSAHPATPAVAATLALLVLGPSAHGAPLPAPLVGRWYAEGEPHTSPSTRAARVSVGGWCGSALRATSSAARSVTEERACSMTRTSAATAQESHP
jgi:hypothetical protein